MSYRGRRSWRRFEERSSRPHGLRGKAIGMYYKKQSKAKVAKVISLKIKPEVITTMKTNIHSIMELAKQTNIDIIKKKNEFANFFGYDSDDDEKTFISLESVPCKKEMLSEEFQMPSTSEVKVEMKIYDPMEQTDDFIPVNTEPVNIKPDTRQLYDPREQTDDFIPINTEPVDITPNTRQLYDPTEQTDDFIPINIEPVDIKPDTRLLSLRGAGYYKYSYEDIVTASFEEKLEECLSKGISIQKKDNQINDFSFALHEDYKEMITKDKYLEMKKFREMLPAFKKSKEILNVINNNQVIVISGETGCGKSTQVPQIILDDAIVNNVGANVKILVTQPRRIAASSLAMRVADERAEKIGSSVGYIIRLEGVEPRSRGSIMFCTTGILLAELEINQSLGEYSHIILDEVHERDCDIDLSMCTLKQVLEKRKDLKLILMSATIDADTLSAYFNNCPMLHIEGLAYPVKDVYLEEVLQMTQFKLPPPEIPKLTKVWHKYTKKGKMACAEMERDIQYKANIGPWLESMKSKLGQEVYTTLKNYKIEDLNINLIYRLLVEICKGEPGAILVFLPGITDITKLLTKMRESGLFPNHQYEIYPLHSRLPSVDQHKIFQRPPPHIRKIIAATNIAETSITIDDIVYVVDCGKIKYSGLNVEKNISTLKTEWVSKANLRQRRGRAGRCQPGICYHLVTSFRAEQLEERLLPEIQRSNLLVPVLAVKKLRLGKAAEALNQLPSPPADTTIQWAIRHLQEYGALNKVETLTPLGWHLARLPLHPAAGKLLLLGALFGCLDRAASLAAIWGFKDPFQMVIGKEESMDRAKRNLSVGEPSDHVAMTEAILQWERCPTYSGKRNFARLNFLSMNILEMLSDMKKQLGDNLKNMGFLSSGKITDWWENRNAQNMSLFKAVVAASLYPNIATVRWTKPNYRNPNKLTKIRVMTPEEGRVNIHPSSVMSTKVNKRYKVEPASVCREANWLVYWLKQKTSDLFLFDVTLVHTLPLLFFGELKLDASQDENEEENCIISISSVKVSCNKTTMKLLTKMRGLLDQVLTTKIATSSNHATQHSPFEERVLDAVLELITAEDESVLHCDDESESDFSESNYPETYQSESDLESLHSDSHFSAPHHSQAHPLESHHLQTHPLESHHLQTHPLESHHLQTHPLESHHLQIHHLESHQSESNQSKSRRWKPHHTKSNRGSPNLFRY